MKILAIARPHARIIATFMPIKEMLLQIGKNFEEYFDSESPNVLIWHPLDVFSHIFLCNI